MIGRNFIEFIAQVNINSFVWKYVRCLDEIWCKNELLGRALQIIQDEEYLDDVDFDEIKRRKRQSPFTKNQFEDEIISETMEAFKEALKLNEIVEIPKIQIHREKRQVGKSTKFVQFKQDQRYSDPKARNG